jgi:hypothetical protein
MRIITYWANTVQDANIERMTKHTGQWFNPEEDYYVMEDPSNETLTVLSLLGIEFDIIKGKKNWQEVVKEAMQ